jgi:hypothetical protein
MRPALLLTALAVLLPACASTGMINSLDDLTAHVEAEGTLSFKQQRLLSLAGLIPTAPPGEIYRYDGERPPFTAIGISHKQEPPGSGHTASYVHERTIATDKTVVQLVEIRDKLVEVRQKAAELISARLTRVSAEKDKRSSADSQVATAQKAFDKAMTEAIKMLDGPGLMVIRAETSSSSSLAAKFGTILGLSSDGSRASAGFALLAGLRTSFLHVGHDIVDRIDLVPHDWSLIGRKFPWILGASWISFFGLFDFPMLYPGQISRDVYFVVTSRLEAEYVLYAQDSVVESKIQAKLDATYEQLSTITNLAQTEKLQIEAVLARVESLGSAGILGPVKERVTLLSESGFFFTDASQDDGGGEEFEGELDRGDGEGDEPNDGTLPGVQWTTVYAIMSEIDDISSLMSGNPRLHFTSLF